MQKCIQKEHYMTLGPKLFFSFDESLFDADSVSEKKWARIPEALDEISNSVIYEQDLKPVSKSDILGFTGGVFMDFSARRAY